MTQYCKNCNNPIIDDSSLFCTKCGSRIDPISPKPVVKKNETVYNCPFCGTDVLYIDSPYCPNCLQIVKPSLLGLSVSENAIDNYPILIGKDISLEFCCDILSRTRIAGEKILCIIKGKAGVNYQNGKTPQDKPYDKNFYHFLIVTNFKILVVPCGYESYNGDRLDYSEELNVEQCKELFFGEIRLSNSNIYVRFRSKDKSELTAAQKTIQDQLNFRKNNLVLLCPLGKFYSISIPDWSVICEYLSKYLTNQSEIRIGLIQLLHTHGLEHPENYPGIPFIRENTLDGIKDFFSAEYYEQLQNDIRRAGSTEKMEQFIEYQKMVQDVAPFLVDLEKLYRLFEKKSIRANYFIILDTLKEIIDKNREKELSDYFDSFDDAISSLHRIISTKLGPHTEKTRIVREFIHFMNKHGMDLSDESLQFTVLRASKLLDKFQMRYSKAELNEIVINSIEEEKLEEFEQNLGAPPLNDSEIISEDFRDMDGYEFEDFLLQIFECLGYSVLNTPLSGDQGADLVMLKDNEKTIVQAKHYSEAVPNRAVQEIVAAKNFYKAKYAMVVTSGSFTKSAIELAQVNNVELWDGNQLLKTIRMINEGRTKKIPSSITVEYHKDGDDFQTFEIICPICDTNLQITMNVMEYNEFECPACGSKFSVNGRDN